MEVRVRWPCRTCSQPLEGNCHDCNGSGYVERWVPYSLLDEVRALFNVVISGCRKIPDYPNALS